MHDDSRKAIFAAFAANVAIAILKFIGFGVTGSAGMFAEGVHSLADTGNQGLLLLGGRRASRVADRQHPFGYGRERYFWSFVVALVLFSVGGLFAIYEAIEKLVHPHSPDELRVAVAILVGAMGLETFSLITAVREANPLRNGQSWWGFLRTSRTADLPVLLLEDSAALCGLALALAGVVLASVTGNGRWDAVGSLAIGLLLIAVAAFLAIKMKGLLIGEAASAETEQAIVAAMTGAADLQQIIHLRTQHLGPDDILLAAKVEFIPGLTVEQLAAAIDAVEALVRAAVPEVQLIYLEPDIHHGGTVGGPGAVGGAGGASP
jgi:cation diffusion facilitator family transporter